MKQFCLWIILFPLLVGCQQYQSSETQSSNTQVEHQPAEYVKNENQTSRKEPKTKVVLDVPLISQSPELKYGCEVTSTAMMLQFAGIDVSKMELFKRVKKDSNPIVMDRGNIIKWGDPNVGFVGDMTGKKTGYAVFDQPIEELINEYLPGKAVNFTNQSFSKVLGHVEDGFPVVVWTTGNHQAPDRWESWVHDGKKIRTPLDLHAVVLVGYDPKFVYVNDPLSGKKQVKITRKTFLASWKALGKRAVSYYE